MAQTFDLDTTTKMLGRNLIQNVEDAFYEELRPKLDIIARNTARKLARSLQGYIYSEYNYLKGNTEILLKFNDEDLKF